MIEFRHHPDRTVRILSLVGFEHWQPVGYSDLFIRVLSDSDPRFVHVEIKHEDDIEWDEDDE